MQDAAVLQQYSILCIDENLFLNNCCITSALVDVLTDLPLDKVAAISQTIFF